MRTLDRILRAVENTIAVGALLAACALALLAVIMRASGLGVIFWSEEAIIYLIIYSTFFGAVIALRENEHVSVDILPVVLKGRAKKLFVILGAVVTVVYAVFIVFLSWELIGEPFSRETITPALKAPLWVLELSLAVGMTLFLLRAIEMVVAAVRATPEELEEAEMPEGLDEFEVPTESALLGVGTGDTTETAARDAGAAGAAASSGTAVKRSRGDAAGGESAADGEEGRRA